ncbi:soluble lytic murein transglycosylase [Stakelama sediminis]|uniref:Soluble lytic murein transglycosylase n=1 Tax=Stakelama sediminis TaxID=463200 RepID=A0A840YZA2_9SPHN|nr:soluble lytic murein transglycosylase [Stakelama sediminis]
MASASGIALTTSAAPPPPAQPMQTASVTNDAELANSIAEWESLRKSGSTRFADYAAFLLAHPGWPDSKRMRIAAEGAMDQGYSPGFAVQFFKKYPPLTSTGRVQYAEALLANGDTAAADVAARDAWRAGVMRSSDEASILGGFASALTPADYDARMDTLLWQGATSSAGRVLAMVSPQARPVLAARLAFRTNSPTASDLDAAVIGAGRADAGFIADRAAWLRNSGNSPEARTYLANRPTLVTRPSDPEKWYEVLLANARAAEHDGQYELAYRIASRVDDAYPAGTDVSTKSYGERDDYTSLVWLAGTVAMQDLHRPADAIGMFERYGNASQTPQTRSKGRYWAGRAAQAAGKQQLASNFYQQAAGYPDLYYGQLAKERMHEPLVAPTQTGPANVSPLLRQVFYSSEVVKAAEYLGRTGDWRDQTAFVRQIAMDAKTDDDHALAIELSHQIKRPDLGVMIGRSAMKNGLTDYNAAGYPAVAVPAGYQNDWTMIHAIARQESQFDRAAISHAGARGLMQLMPATAREAAGKLGLAYSSDSLTRDPQYNIQLGSSYFQRMLSYYDGSYPLAVAAYNAGPGNVNKWIRANGDPRTAGVDMVEWIEEIPIYETKNYVQRVLENAVVYDLLNPQHANSKGPDNLSWYLGKTTPG